MASRPALSVIDEDVAFTVTFGITIVGPPSANPGDLLVPFGYKPESEEDAEAAAAEGLPKRGILLPGRTGTFADASNEACTFFFPIPDLEVISNLVEGRKAVTLIDETNAQELIDLFQPKKIRDSFIASKRHHDTSNLHNTAVVPENSGADLKKQRRSLKSNVTAQALSAAPSSPRVKAANRKSRRSKKDEDSDPTKAKVKFGLCTDMYDGFELPRFQKFEAAANAFVFVVDPHDPHAARSIELRVEEAFGAEPALRPLVLLCGWTTAVTDEPVEKITQQLAALKQKYGFDDCVLLRTPRDSRLSDAKFMSKYGRCLHALGRHIVASVHHRFSLLDDPIREDGAGNRKCCAVM